MTGDESVLLANTQSLLLQQAVHVFVKGRDVYFCLVALDIFQECIVDQGICKGKKLIIQWLFYDSVKRMGMEMTFFEFYSTSCVME